MASKALIHLESIFALSSPLPLTSAACLVPIRVGGTRELHIQSLPDLTCLFIPTKRCDLALKTHILQNQPEDTLEFRLGPG